MTAALEVAAGALLAIPLVLGPLPWALIVTVLAALLVIALVGQHVEAPHDPPVEHHHCRVVREPVDWEREGWL